MGVGKRQTKRPTTSMNFKQHPDHITVHKIEDEICPEQLIQKSLRQK
jgi:hypothetical protein